jgi:hypothetical protein
MITTTLFNWLDYILTQHHKYTMLLQVIHVKKTQKIWPKIYLFKISNWESKCMCHETPYARCCKVPRHSVLFGREMIWARKSSHNKSAMELDLSQYVHDPAYLYIREDSLRSFAPNIQPLHLVNEAQARYQRDKRQREQAAKERHTEHRDGRKRMRLLRKQKFQNRHLQVWVHLGSLCWGGGGFTWDQWVCRIYTTYPSK